MRLLTELSHVLLYEDDIPLRRKSDYETVTEYRKPQTYTIVSKDRKQLWSLCLVKFLGPEGRFLLNGKGDGYRSPIEAAMAVNTLLTVELAASA